MVIHADDFDCSILKNYGILEKTRKRNSVRYLNVICAFDIEASRLKDIEQSFMYIWQFQIGDDYTIIGRYWSEFYDLILRMKPYLEDMFMVVYVHNLSYEFAFLKGIYSFSEDEVFCTDNRKVLKCLMHGCMEFRCSYQLTNMSLDRFLKKIGRASCRERVCLSV